MVVFRMNLHDENFSFKVVVLMPYSGIMVKVQMVCVCVSCRHLNSVPLLQQRGDALLQGAAGSLLLLCHRSQLLLQPMALRRQLAHFNLECTSTGTQFLRDFIYSLISLNKCH